MPSPVDKVRFAPPALLLPAVNMLPIAGVLFGGWTLLDVVALYWFENVLVGGINIVKMISCAPDEQQLRRAADQSRSTNHASGKAADAPISPLQHHASKFFLVPFFTFHYGIFCLIHGVFVFGLLGAATSRAWVQAGPVGELRAMIEHVVFGETAVAALALLASHACSYLYHFLGRGEFRRQTAGELMIAPYGRVVVLHLAILFGAFFTICLGQPLAVLLLLIFGKTAVDWHMHVRAHA